MPINFPHLDHVHLKVTPLREVIAQVRFPPILRIGKEEPINLQDRIRQKLPKYQSEQGFQLSYSINEGLLANPKHQAVTYRFLSPDEKTTASLSTDFYALATQKYNSWHEFSEELA